MISAMYEDIQTLVECSGGKTEPISVRRGVLQGDPLSPLLFNICIDFILRDLNQQSIKSKLGFAIDDELSLTVFAFADDMVVIARNRKSMEILT